MNEQNFKYLVHLKAGDIVKIGGLPFELFGDADFGINTSPEGIVEDGKWEIVDPSLT